MRTDGEANETFMPLAEAAARLGVSRLKLREAIAKGIVAARRDNLGRLRVDLTAAPADVAAATAGTGAPLEALMQALFDEIEELSADLEGAREENARLLDLAGAQAAALDRAAAALEARGEEAARLAGLVDRALGAAEDAEARAAAMRGTADRALALLEGAAAALDRSRSETERLSAALAEHRSTAGEQARMLDRLFSLSETALAAAERHRSAPGLIARVFGGGRSRK